MSNKICEIVKLQQILKKWRKIANSKKSSCNKQVNAITNGGKSIKFFKKTLSFSDNNNNVQGITRDATVPKGSLAVCVGEEMKRFIIPMEYLGCQAFDILLKEAEEEFGFQQEGVLRIPCEVCVFEEILKLLEEKKDADFTHEYVFTAGNTMGCSLAESQLSNSHHPQSPICR